MQPLFLLIDIDNTLYEYSETGFNDEMHDRIFSFAEKNLGISTAQAEQLSRKYFMNYGLSLYGYVKEYKVNPKEYSDYVHHCSYDKLKYNEPLVAMLQSMQYRPEGAVAGDEDSVTGGVDHLYYFTNANRSHARRVLDPQGLRPIFTRPRHAGSPIKEYHRLDDEAGFEDQVEWLGFSYEDQWRLTQPDFANKPMRRAYEAIYRAIEDQIAEETALLQDIGNAAGASASSPSAQLVHSRRTHLHPRNVVMVDDSLINLDAPLELGWSAVWYAHDNLTLPTDPAVNACAPLYAAAIASGRLEVIHHILELKSAVQRIREANMKASADGEKGC
ncbi:hypothetical protein ABL78_2311 [Leptomonas seymouri]|uniref:Uncharacterized protein n=1 Tax=Leptomonas seymouri TaxID=5684 RepID=A0A0N1I684_LEPSE|nr:hypothetical protein ABL78_2311 [Leptomonas seymouri]|eukprot:KPI88578.1 hypothetical protein ABL78_2311 [Leptomonas seymouri]